MATIAPSPPVTTAFPQAAVEAKLRAELIDTVKSTAKFKGLQLPSAPGHIAAASVQIDSLVCVEILCAVEPIVGFELPEKVVKAGGYGSIEQAIQNLVPRIQAEWSKKKGVAP